MKKKLIGLAVILGVLLFAVVAYYRFQVTTKNIFFGIFPIYAWTSVDQPIVFNHLRHIETAKLNCTFCHRYVERERVAGIPNIELCQACHSTDAISKRPQAVKVMGYVKTAQEIPWKRMYELPKHVVFPHWVHVQNQIECSVCHGLTGSSERPIRMVDRLYMEWCLDCHKKREASEDCYACHSS
jgi:hypothetical protein